MTTQPATPDSQSANRTPPRSMSEHLARTADRILPALYDSVTRSGRVPNIPEMGAAVRTHAEFGGPIDPVTNRFKAEWKARAMKAQLPDADRAAREWCERMDLAFTEPPATDFGLALEAFQDLAEKMAGDYYATFRETPGSRPTKRGLRELIADYLDNPAWERLSFAEQRRVIRTAHIPSP